MNVSGNVEGWMMSVSVNGALLRCETNADFSYDIDMLPATNPNEGRWRSYIPGVQTWGLTVNGNLLLQSLGADFKTLVEAAKNGDRMLVRFGTLDDITPGYAIEGYTYVRSLGLGAPSVGNANWSVSFQGDGAFTTDWEEFGLIIDNNPIEAEWPLIYDANE